MDGMRIIRMRAAAVETVAEAAMMERPAAAWVAAVIETVLMAVVGTGAARIVVVIAQAIAAVRCVLTCVATEKEAASKEVGAAR